MAEYLPSADRLPAGALWQRSKVGVEGGIPDSSLIPTFTTLAATSTAAQINAAIVACPVGQAVVLGAGTFTLTEAIVMKSGIVLRGLGASVTTLNFTGGGFGLIQFMGPYADGLGAVNWTAGYAQGTTAITLDSVAGLAVGRLVGIDQLNDSAIGADEDGSAGTCTFCSRSSGTRGQVQYGLIEEINGLVVTLSHPVLAANYASGLSPQLWPIGTPISDAGVESLKIVNVAQNIATQNIYLQGCWGCWVRNVHSMGAEQSHIRTIECGRIEIIESTFQETENYGSGSYGINLTYTSHSLIENNIFDEITSPLSVWGGSSGNVIAYNFTNNMRYDVSAAWLSECAFTHGLHPMMNLFEGNHVTNFYWDFIHGSASHNTSFRNRVTGHETGKTANTFPVVCERNNRYHVFVGNVLGTSGYHTRYKLDGTVQTGNDDYIYVLGYAGTDQSTLVDHDPLVGSTVELRGNYNHAENAINAAEDLAGSTLANSWYLTSKPTWFGNRPFPWVDAALPAQAIDENLPAGYRFLFGVSPPGADPDEEIDSQPDPEPEPEPDDPETPEDESNPPPAPDPDDSVTADTTPDPLRIIRPTTAALCAPFTDPDLRDLGQCRSAPLAPGCAAPNGLVVGTPSTVIWVNDQPQFT